MNSPARGKRPRGRGRPAQAGEWSGAGGLIIPVGGRIRINLARTLTKSRINGLYNVWSKFQE